MANNLTLTVLEKATKLVETRWCQGHHYPEKLCLWYAIMDAARASDDDSFDTGYAAAVRLVVRELGKEYVGSLLGDSSSLIKWNDKPGRTKEEVVAVLRAAQQKARNASETSQEGR